MRNNNPTASTPTLLLNATEASRQLAISPRTLWAISAPRGPVPVVRIGRSVRYDPLDLRDWLEAQKIGGTRS
jgi:predicted DNA-binding transcriptional regulator AlpA